MPGILYVVGTPIGNLEDMSVRAVRTLEEVDFIAAEDTRVTLKLLNHFSIKKPMISYHDHNIREKGEAIIAKLLAGENGAIVTDAGMPCISDPGEDLVKQCAEQGIEIIPVPGPSAVIAGLAISGLPTSRFSFEGFLSTSKKQRFEHLESVKTDRRTLIFYEAPHKLLQTLMDLKEHLGERRISMCREMTKLHEEVLRMTLSEAIEYYTEKSPRGEYVLIVDGAPEEALCERSSEEIMSQVKELIGCGMKPTDACREVAKMTGKKKSELYKMLLDGEGEE